MMHYTCYTKPILFDASAVIHNPDCIITGYHGGYSTKIWNLSLDDDLRMFRDGDLSKDVVPFLVMRDEVEGSYIDITGHMNAALGGVTDDDDSETAFYSTYKEYCEWLGFKHPPESQPFFFPVNYNPVVEKPRTCTLVFRDHHWVYGNTDRPGDLGRAVTHTGPLGPDFYPTCADTRRIETITPVRRMGYGERSQLVPR